MLSAAKRPPRLGLGLHQLTPTQQHPSAAARAGNILRGAPVPCVAAGSACCKRKKNPPFEPKLEVFGRPRPIRTHSPFLPCPSVLCWSCIMGLRGVRMSLRVERHEFIGMFTHAPLSSAVPWPSALQLHSHRPSALRTSGRRKLAQPHAALRAARQNKRGLFRNIWHAPPEFLGNPRKSRPALRAFQTHFGTGRPRLEVRTRLQLAYVP